MTTRETKRCRVCGREFVSSATGKTVNCPEHRGRPETKRKRVGPREVPAGGRTCTVVVGHSGRRCGKPAVFAFESTVTGEIFAECAEHEERH